MNKYRTIIALEGIDGAGKTTLINSLKEEYEGKICVYSRTKKGRYAKSLLNRSIVKNNYFLQIPIYIVLGYKNYFSCVCKSTAPILLMDRCFLSNICYYYPSAMNNKILYFFAMLFELKLFPDVIFIIDEDAAVAQKRDMMQKDLTWLSKTRLNYLNAPYATALSKYKIFVIQNNLTIEEKRIIISRKIKSLGGVNK